MSSRAFVDTNVFVYAIDRADPVKQKSAQRVLAEIKGLTVVTSGNE